MYKSVYYKVYGDVGSHLYKSEITPENINEIKSNMEKISQLLSIADYYLMVIDNCLDFINDCQLNGPGDDKVFVRANRLLLNALNSYYVWQEYSKHHSFNSQHRKLIKDIKKQGVLELANRIRHAGVHHNSPITVSTSDVINEKVGFYIEIDKLFDANEHSGFNKRIIDYLSTSNKLETVSLIKDLLREFNNYNYEIWKSIHDDFFIIMDSLMAYVPDHSPDCFNCVIVNEETGERIDIGRTLELVAIKSELIGLDLY